MQIRKIIYVFLISTILGYLAYSYLHYSHFGEFPNYSGNKLLLFSLIMGSCFIGFSVIGVNAMLGKLSIWQKRIGFRFILGLIVNYIIVMLAIYACIYIYIKLTGMDSTVGKLKTALPEIKARVYILILFLDILLSVFNLLIYSYKYYSHGQIQVLQLKRKQIELQFEALRTQLSPHYLFNSLNTISSLIYKDVNQTEEYIRKLANTYQYILQSDKKQLISLKEEVNFINDYCFLLKIRFGDAFKIYMDILNTYSDYLIPPLSIQILIENAVKHNVFDDEQALEVDLITKDNMVYVKNKILKSPESRESFNIGLGNIRKRYEIFTDKKIRIVQNEFFTVELPLLNPGNTKGATKFDMQIQNKALI